MMTSQLDVEDNYFSVLLLKDSTALDVPIATYSIAAYHEMI